MFTALALAIAVLLVGGVIGAVGVGTQTKSVATPGASGHSVFVGSDSTPNTQPGPAGEVEAAIPAIERFVQNARGLKFTGPVKVTALDDAAFRKRFQSQPLSKVAVAQLKTTERVLTALGLIPHGTDLSKTETSLYSSAVLGLYEPKTKELLVRGATPTALVRTTLAHELTHALQDQHFDLAAKGKGGKDDEKADGFQGLVEGDAVRIQNLYLASLSDAEQKAEVQQEMALAGGIPPDIPQALIAFAQFPYIFGPTFVDKVIAAAGVDRLNKAFGSPPITTEQVMHPELYLAGQGPATVEKPKADAAEIDHGVFGEFAWLIILSKIDQTKALQAAAGWGGDRYVAWQAGGNTCVRDTIAHDTPKDAAEFRASVDKWAKDNKSVKVGSAAAGGLTITACG